MHDDPSIVTWPDYREFRRWLETEVAGLSDAHLDFDSQDPAREWMWWSIRRQVSHVAWVFLAVMRRRCHTFLWPDGNMPAPVRWEDHTLPNMKSRPPPRRRTALGNGGFAGQAAARHRVGDAGRQHGGRSTPCAPRSPCTGPRRFWKHVIQVLPRGGQRRAARDPGRIRYTLEASLWMLYWEVLAHLFTIQRLKRAHGLPTPVAIPRVGYLTLPEYTGESEEAAPGASCPSPRVVAGGQ